MNDFWIDHERVIRFLERTLTETTEEHKEKQEIIEMIKRQIRQEDTIIDLEDHTDWRVSFKMYKGSYHTEYLESLLKNMKLWGKYKKEEIEE